MPKYLQKQGKLCLTWLSTLILTTTVPLNLPATGKISQENTPTQQNQGIELANLEEGEIVVTGSKGRYTGKLLIKAPLTTAWSVLTDYNNFDRFLPNVVSSQVIESNGNKKVFEQVNAINALIFSKEVRFRIAATETYPQQIVFQVISGDVKSLRGVWTLQVVSNNILIEHQVTIDPGGGAEKELFFLIYRDNLEDNLQAIKAEIKRRFPG